jgi:hypothetical protein
VSLQVRATLHLLLCSLTCCSGTGPSFGPSFVGTVAGWNCHLKKSLQSLQESCDVQGGNLSVTNPSVHCCCTCCFCFSFKNQEIRHHHQNIPCPRKAINIHKLHLPLHQTSSDLIRPHQTVYISQYFHLSSTEAHSAAVRPKRLPSHGFHPPSAVGLPHPPPPSVPSANLPTSPASHRVHVGFTEVHNDTPPDCPIVQIWDAPKSNQNPVFHHVKFEIYQDKPYSDKTQMIQMDPNGI